MNMCCWLQPPGKPGHCVVEFRQNPADMHCRAAPALPHPRPQPRLSRRRMCGVTARPTWPPAVPLPACGAPPLSGPPGGPGPPPRPPPRSWRMVLLCWPGRQRARWKRWGDAMAQAARSGADGLLTPWYLCNASCSSCLGADCTHTSTVTWHATSAGSGATQLAALLLHWLPNCCPSVGAVGPAFNGCHRSSSF